MTREKLLAVSYDEIRLDRSAIHYGHLILVNREHPVQLKESSLDLLPLTDICSLDDNLQLFLEKTCLQHLSALVSTCQGRDDIIAVSGYCSRAEQQELYETSVRENGAAFTDSFVARPDESEHQTGLAVDVGENKGNVDFICPTFPDQGVCQLFKNRAAEHGFIQRYKSGKEHLTNIACEPWHFRYVGFPHSVIMENHDFCLEEYIAFLKRFEYAKEHLFFENEDSTIEIYYVQAAEDSTVVPITNRRKYHLSGNNDDGFIVTVFHEKGSEHTGGIYE